MIYNYTNTNSAINQTLPGLAISIYAFIFVMPIGMTIPSLPRAATQNQEMLSTGILRTYVARCLFRKCIH